jgi:hypothetical protein
LSWPRGRREGQQQRGQASIVVDADLARAIRSESAVALKHWLGVREGVVSRWRKALGVSMTNNPGTNRLVRAAAQKAGASHSGKEWTEEEREQRRQRAIEGNYIAHFPPGCRAALLWKPEELALLGTATDKEVGKRIGKSREAVQAQRRKLKIPPAGGAKGGRPNKR